MTNRKFCMVTTFYPPHNFGGDGILVHWLVQALANDGHQVHVIHDGDAYSLLAKGETPSPVPPPPGVTVHTLWRRALPGVQLLASHQLGRPIGAHRSIRTLIEGNNFDVVHFHNISLLGGPQVLSYGKGIKLCSMHDYWFVCPMHVLWRYNREACTRRTCLPCTLAGRRPPQLWRYTGSVSRAVGQVDAFIVHSNSSREIHAANGFPVPIRFIPAFVPAGGEPGGSAAAGRPLPGRPYFLFAGRLEKIKGVQVLLEVFRHYKAADLLIAGSGMYEDTLREMGHGLPHVQFLGRLDHARLRALYQSAIAVLVPSLCYETFGLIIVEAFAMRTPAIVSNRGALPEVIRSGGGGFVFQTPQELVEAMERLRTEPELRRQLGEEGYRNYLKNYTEEQHLKKYYDLIEELESARGPEGVDESTD